MGSFLSYILFISFLFFVFLSGSGICSGKKKKIPDFTPEFSSLQRRTDDIYFSVSVWLSFFFHKMTEEIEVYQAFSLVRASAKVLVSVTKSLSSV